MTYKGKIKCKWGWHPSNMDEDEKWNHEPHYECDKCGEVRPEGFGFYDDGSDTHYCKDCAFILKKITEKEYLLEEPDPPNLFLAVKQNQKVVKCHGAYPPFHPQGSKIKRIRKRYQNKRDDLYKMVKNRDGEICQNCNSKENLELDHKKPVSRGGGNNLDNLQILCRDCNAEKSAKTMEEWKENKNGSS
jgi:5-methylcytosine-specific restriction endonuclease McrA